MRNRVIYSPYHGFFAGFTPHPTWCGHESVELPHFNENEVESEIEKLKKLGFSYCFAYYQRLY